MPYKEKTIEKLYWSIGEVAEQLGVNTSLIRYWEKEFGTLRPKRTGKGDRLYTKKDIEQLQRIQHLVKEKGLHVARCAGNSCARWTKWSHRGHSTWNGLRDRLTADPYANW